MLTGCIPGGLRGIHVGDVSRLRLPFCDTLLSGLSISSGALTPAFDAFETSYTSEVSVPQITVTPLNDHGASFRFLDRRYGERADADEALEGFQVDLESSINVIRVWVSSPDEAASHAYNIEVRRLDLNAEPAFNDGEGNPITATSRSISENAPAGAHIAHRRACGRHR